MTLREQIICRHGVYGCRKTADCKRRDDLNTKITGRLMLEWIGKGRPGQVGHYVAGAMDQDNG